MVEKIPDVEVQQPWSRRRFLATAPTAALAWNLAKHTALATEAAAPSQYRVAACDWMILKRQELGAFSLAKELGVDGLEVDMGSLGERETFDNQLAKADVRDQFLKARDEYGIEICSMAMSGFYAQSFAERATVDRMVGDCLETMKAMGAKLVFLPLGVKCDLVQHPELRPVIVERLKAAGKRAEDAGVVIGIETALDAAGDVALLEEIGSPAIRIYFNFGNALQNSRDLLAELRTLGRERICQIHATNQDGFWLEKDPKVDMPAIKKTLDEMNWSGWLVIERSRDRSDPTNVKWNFSANAKYLKRVFQA